MRGKTRRNYRSVLVPIRKIGMDRTSAEIVLDMVTGKIGLAEAIEKIVLLEEKREIDLDEAGAPRRPLGRLLRGEFRRK